MGFFNKLAGFLDGKPKEHDELVKSIIKLIKTDISIVDRNSLDVDKGFSFEINFSKSKVIEYDEVPKGLSHSYIKIVLPSNNIVRLYNRITDKFMDLEVSQSLKTEMTQLGRKVHDIFKKDIFG